jgi:hypothetical protein
MTGNFHVKIIDNHSVDIKERLTVDGNLLDLLVKDGVLTNNEKETIKACCV